MKKTRHIFLASAAMATAFVITACGNNGGGSKPTPPVDDFSFNLYFDSRRTDTLYKGEEETLIIHENNPGTKEHTYTYELRGSVTIGEGDEAEVKPASDFVTVEFDEEKKEFTVTPDEHTYDQLIGIRVEADGDRNTRLTQWFKISERHAPANSGYNFSANTEKKSEILGELEAYAMKNYLTGITLFENGGYVRKKSRVHYGTENYVTGYGFGLLTEGYLDMSDPQQPDVTAYESYLQSAQSSDPGNISGWNATGSQVSELYGYITTSFWGTKLNSAKTGYDWYPVLAAEDCLNPEPVNPTPGVSIHKKYRIYVKTGNTGDGFAIKYRSLKSGDYDPTNPDANKFNNRPVKLEDYITTFKLLLTQSSNLTRGAELATDTSYGLKGAYSYFRKTKGATDEQADKFWKDMTDDGQLGIVADSDDRGEYLEFEFLNPIDVFTAKYTLSSNLYSPLPESFLKQIGGGSWIRGGEVFGTGSKTPQEQSQTGAILSNVLNLGPYMLEEWRADQEIVFKRDDNWFEYTKTQTTDRPRYRIPGVHYQVVTAATQRDDAIYDMFNSNLLDQTGIPASRINEKVGSDKPTKGDATFKLNVNSCDQTRWDELFWSNKYPDVKKPTQHRTVHPWMSNKNFLDGLFWSINRSEFAELRGSTGSYNYFADAYMDDPVSGHSYNASKAHKDAEDAFDPMLRSSGGYSKSKATSSFIAAIKELEDNGQITAGSYANPTLLTIQIEWMYSNDETTYGQDIANYFVAAFDRNQPELQGYRLNITHHAGSQWEQVYNDHLMVGDFDLGFGAISGNTLNPLNFMEVLKSDNSSGFTLNWGKDTALVDEDDPITFDVTEGDKTVTREWSFDSAWAAADHGAVVKDGKPVDSVEKGYTSKPISPVDPSKDTDRLANGGIMPCVFGFTRLGKGVEFEISRIQVTLVGYGSITIDESNIEILTEPDEDDPEILYVVGFKINFDNTVTDPKYEDMTLSQFINKMLFDGLHLQAKVDALDKTDPEYQTKKEELENPFAYTYYGAYWWIDVYYNITITGSEPTENYYMVEKVASTQPSSLAKLGGR